MSVGVLEGLYAHPGNLGVEGNEVVSKSVKSHGCMSLGVSLSTGGKLVCTSVSIYGPYGCITGVSLVMRKFATCKLPELSALNTEPACVGDFTVTHEVPLVIGSG